MKDKLKGVLIAIAAIAVLAAGGAAIAGAANGGDENGRDDGAGKAITGQALDRAKAAALKHTGGGKVTATEAGDEEGAYEVEVTQADGSQADVHLDKGFNVISESADGNGDGDQGEDGN
jgi:uncharacterized membrane protein YkoI